MRNLAVLLPVLASSGKSIANTVACAHDASFAAFPHNRKSLKCDHDSVLDYLGHFSSDLSRTQEHPLLINQLSHIVKTSTLVPPKIVANLFLQSRPLEIGPLCRFESAGLEDLEKNAIPSLVNGDVVELRGDEFSRLPIKNLKLKEMLESGLSTSDLFVKFSRLFPKDSSKFDAANIAHVNFVKEIMTLGFLFDSLVEHTEFPVALRASLDAVQGLSGTVAESGFVIIQKTIERIVKNLEKSLGKDEFVVNVITFSRVLSKRQATPPALPPGVSPLPLSVCPQDVISCYAAFRNCSNHGRCQETKYLGRSCFRCSCSRKNLDDNGNIISQAPAIWSGSACQYKDISTDFHLLFWTSIGLVLALGFALSMIMGAGNEQGSGSSSAYGHQKND